MTAGDLSALSLRDSIPLPRQQLGMIVYVEPMNGAAGADRYYRLLSLSVDSSTPLVDSDWQRLLESDVINLSDNTNFSGQSTVQGALDSIILQLNAISPGGFQGSWDGTGIPQIPIVVPLTYILKVIFGELLYLVI